MSALQYTPQYDEDEGERRILKEEALKYVDTVLMPQERLDHPRSTALYFTRRRLQLIQRENRKIDEAIEQVRAKRNAWRAMQRDSRARGERGDQAPDKYADL